MPGWPNGAAGTWRLLGASPPLVAIAITNRNAANLARGHAVNYRPTNNENRLATTRNSGQRASGSLQRAPTSMQKHQTVNCFTASNTAVQRRRATYVRLT